MLDNVDGGYKSRTLQPSESDAVQHSGTEFTVFHDTLNKPLSAVVGVPFKRKEIYSCALLEMTGLILYHDTGKKTSSTFDAFIFSLVLYKP